MNVLTINGIPKRNRNTAILIAVAEK